MNLKLITTGEAWAGSEEGASYVLDLQSSEAFQAAVAESRTRKEGLPEVPLYQVQGKSGVIPIAGPLINANVPDYLAEMFGVTTYDRVQRSVMAAAADKSVEHIILNTDTGGGSVNGVAQTAELIKHIDKNVKPVISFAGDNMLSAGYWLGSSARAIYASPTAMTGSVGVILVLMDATKQLEAEGLKPTVMRAGEFKALGHPMEALTDQGKANVQAQLDAMYKVFVSHVADSRKTSYEVADKVMGQGRVFVGADGVASGAVDGVTFLSELLAKKHSLSLFDKNVNNGNNNAIGVFNGDIMTNIGGLTTPDLGEGTQVSVPDAAAPVAAAFVANNSADVFASLLLAKDEKILELSVQLAATADLANQLQALEAVSQDLAKVAADSATRMAIALGHPEPAFEGKSLQDVLAVHSATADEFKAKFPAGGVAAISAPSDKQEAPAQEAQVDPMHSARMSAVAFKFKGGK